MKVEKKNPIMDDFIVLFNYLWYRDFPGSENPKRETSPADLNAHTRICVRSCADLMGYFTFFEHGNRIDAVIKNNKDKIVTLVEWEWRPITKVGGNHQPDITVNEVRKLFRERISAEFSVFISYSREGKHKHKNLELIKSQWNEEQNPHPLLVFLITYNYEKHVRKLLELETYRFRNGEYKLVRAKHALPWRVEGARWET